jgi:murein DD-endopeptidase MepM/ murein hydrolase activator NlpD
VAGLVSLVVSLASALLTTGAAPAPKREQSHYPVVKPGTVVRWEAPGTTSCSQAGRVWAPSGETCHFPIDLLATGTLRLERRRSNFDESITVRVGRYPYPVQRLQVDDRMVHPSAKDLARAERESARVKPLWQREGMPRFSLPLATPLLVLPGGGRFGARRIFNGEPRSPHSGVDYAAPEGTPVLAVAEGEVMLAEQHFFSGGSVYIDHGGGLISCSFHLSRIDVTPGEQVRTGQAIGVVGATGRVTGPHLHFGLRWHGARIDPEQLFAAPERIPHL